MAEDWGIPPWIVERDCTENWFDWWLALQNEKAALQEEQANKAKRRSLRK